MTRPVVVVVAATLGVAAALVYSYAARRNDGAEQDRAPLAAKTTQTAAAPNFTAVSPSPLTAAAPVESSDVAVEHEPRAGDPDTLSRWIADTTSIDAKTRVAAIAALATAPRSAAVPVLEQVLESGERQVDRHAALLSLHTLAVQQGDDDGAIRDVLRQAIYHGDDEGVYESAQAFLEDIEAEFAARSPQDNTQP